MSFPLSTLQLHGVPRGCKTPRFDCRYLQLLISIRISMTRPKSKLLVRLSVLGTVGLLAVNFTMTTLLTLASVDNYPGGEALSTFNTYYANETNGVSRSLTAGAPCSSFILVHVHISNLAAQTGASLFLHTHAPPFLSLLNAPSNRNWVYDKTEHLTPQLLTGSKEVTHAIAEYQDSKSPLPAGFSSNYWRPVATISGFDRWTINPQLPDLLKSRGRGLLENLGVLARPLQVVSSEKLVILERKQ